ncbi:TPA: hypothetical protein DCL30_03990 [Candidatus Peribacteria bacterium]|nr:MAG: hypothetical protein A3J91_02000 [Candidatus Peribacteria bacterium RIFOXYC2_FULL_58_10]OGJ83699.1 MAG: hypothetical protein A2529_01290 [Candidatus Peribacteria bacterium RIFOXYD2_FULL_58_15]HAI98665.1 hypothetical protein [Candidatus Peribacteria bacterium]HAS34378.1 hypothetical protein [Candidatus Peribacteria bacterium]
MSDDTIQPLQDRITRIVSEEERLNSKLLKDRKTETERRYAEKQAETAKLATLKKEEAHQMEENARKDRVSQETLRREGEVVHLSEEIQRGFIEETRRREAAKKKIGEQATILEAKLRSIEGARPS